MAVKQYTHRSQLPYAVDAGVGEIVDINGERWVSNGSNWEPVAGEIPSITLAKFNELGGAAAFTGQLIRVDGVLQFCDGTSLQSVGGQVGGTRVIGATEFTGVGDETTVAAAIINAAGNNAEIVWPKNVQVTVSGLTMLPGQTWKNANIKRANKVQAAVTSAITVDGSTTSTVDVADASIFTVGRQVVVSYGTLHVTAAVTIMGKTGNTLLLGSPLSVGPSSSYATDPVLGATETGSWKQADGVTPIGSIASGAYVTEVFKTVTAQRDSKLHNCVIDGNKANWETGHTGNILWWNHIEVFTGTESISGNVVQDCVIKNFAGEGCSESAGTMNGSVPTASQDNAPHYFIYSGSIQWGTRYANNRIYDGGGNGIHLSSINGVRITGNTIDKCNQNLAVRHIGGGIEFSWAGRNIHIEGNVIRRCWNGINDIYLTNHSSLKIAFNELIRNKRHGLHITSATTYAPHDIRIIGNLFIDNTVFINGLNSPISGITAIGNQVYGAVYLRGLVNSEWTGGFVDNTTLSPVEIVAGADIAASASAVVLPAGRYYGAGTRAPTDNLRVYAVGDEVILTQTVAGVPKISGISRITAVGGTATAPIYTLGALDTSFSSLATYPVFIHSAKYRMNTVCTTAITNSSTTSVTLRDPSLFEVGDFIGFSQMSLGYSSTNNAQDNAVSCVRITALDYSTGVATLANAVVQNYQLQAPGTGSAEIRVFKGPSECGIVESGSNSELGNMFVRDCSIVVDTQVIGGIYGFKAKLDCSGSKFTIKALNQRTLGIENSILSTDESTCVNCDVRSHATYSAPWWVGIRPGHGICKGNTVRGTANVTSAGPGAGMWMNVAGFRVIENDVVMAGTGYTYDFSASADNGVYPNNYGRNSGGTTGERIDVGATGNVGSITLLPA